MTKQSDEGLALPWFSEWKQGGTSPEEMAEKQARVLRLARELIDALTDTVPLSEDYPIDRLIVTAQHRHQDQMAVVSQIERDAGEFVRHTIRARLRAIKNVPPGTYPKPGKET